MLQMKIADLLFEDNQGMSFDQELAHAGASPENMSANWT